MQCISEYSEFFIKPTSTRYRVELWELNVDGNRNSQIWLSISPRRAILYPRDKSDFPTSKSTSTYFPQYPLPTLSFERAGSYSLSVTNMGILDFTIELLLAVAEYRSIRDLSKFRSIPETYVLPLPQATVTR